MTPILLDISRLISRLGQGPFTGIDRVEFAYFQHVLQRPEPAYFLCRMPRSYAVLDRKAGLILLNKIKGVTPWGSSGMASVVFRSANPERQQAVADIWRLAARKCSERGLSRCLQGLFPNGVSYLNTGHSNLRAIVFSAVRGLTKSHITVLIHDIIPISSSETVTLETAARFRDDMSRVSAHADFVVYISEHTQKQAELYFSECGRVPDGLVAHPGAGLAPEPGVDLVQRASERPGFLVLGTIEPRKNHLLLLNIWQEFVRNLPKDDIPDLHVVGRRGWENTEVFDILDHDPMVGKHVFEHNDLGDREVLQMLAASWALLFPSLAEGFGLPLVEAARCGVPIICGENSVYREILGDYPLYLNVDNSYAWSQGILERAGRKRESEAERQVRGGSVILPDWAGHFDRIFRFV